MNKGLLKVGIVLLVVLIGIVMVWQLVIKRQARENVTKITDALVEQRTGGVSNSLTGTDGDVVTYELLNGWNLVAFPMIPRDFSTASELIKQVNVQGGYITTVAYWDTDKWRELSWRADQQYGHDFELEVGRAYFVRNHARMTWAVAGEPLAREEYALDLHEGWNAVGLLVDAGLTAEGLLDEINQGEERATEVNRWWFGLWDPYVKRLYTDETIEQYGEAYDIEEKRGYFVWLNEAVTYTLGRGE